jgi:ribonuclease BN (tRNA processing enzyme)
VLRQLLAAIILAGSPAWGGAALAAASGACGAAGGVALQVLGSGGPVADDGRASSAYLLWQGGRARVLIDAGGGSFLRFGEAGARFDTLDFVGVSHFHTDHSADLPALLKSGYFSPRSRALPIAGPGGSAPFPGLDAFLRRMLAADRGAYGYLSGYLDGTDGLVPLEAVEVALDTTGPVRVLDDDAAGIRVDALPVPHGIVPALAFRVQLGADTIVFAGDQSGDDERFIDFARDAQLLVMHMPVPPGATGAARRLHAPPGRLAEIAQAARPGILVLSHFMARSLADLDGNLRLVRSGFAGRVVAATDLQCIPAPDPPA